MSKDTNTGAKRARELRAALGLADGSPLDCLLTLVEERLSLPVVIAAMEPEIAGCCWRAGDRVLLWVNGSHPPVRQRFTLAHELGHLRCGHDGSLPVETFTTLGGKSTDSREVQANAFAAELLLPAAGVRAQIDPDPPLEDVVALAARHGTSTIAALYRCNTLGLVPTRYHDLHAAIDAGEHEAAWERLGLSPFADEIAAVAQAGALPRLPAALAASALGAVARGEVSTAAAARAAGVAPGALARGAGRIGI